MSNAIFSMEQARITFHDNVDETVRLYLLRKAELEAEKANLEKV